MDYKGDDNKNNNKDNKTTNTFNALVVNINPSTLLDKDDQATVYYTLYGKIELDNTTATALKLANRAYSHIVTTINTITNAFHTNTDLFMYNITLHYTFTKFMGIIINTKASKHSIVGYSQFLTLQKIDKVQLNKSIKGTVSVQFKIGSISSISSIKITTLIGTVEFHVVKVNTPFLLCLADIDNL